jgi:hypothetical protein
VVDIDENYQNALVYGGSTNIFGFFLEIKQ